MTIQTNTNDKIDPVCRMKVAETSNKVLPFTLNENTYFFCAETCRKKFITDPKKYLEKKVPKKKGLWGRYIDRVKKTTGGKSQCCH